MPVHHEKVLASAKAAYPELWPDDLNDFPIPGNAGKAVLARQRQDAIDRIGRALETYENVKPADTSSAVVVLVPPDEAAMVQQVLAVTAYIDHDGRNAYSVKCIGDGLLTTWLGMGEMAKDWLLRNFRGLQQ